MSGKNFTMEGTAFWAKVLGDPQPTYDEKGNEWSINVSLSERGKNLITRLGMVEKIKNKDDDQGEFVTFRRSELKKSGDEKGEPNKPIPVLDAAGEPWDQEKLIGNGSKVKVKFNVFEMPARGKFKAFAKLVIQQIQVLELKEYKKPDAKEKPQADPKAAKQIVQKPAANQEEADWETDGGA